MDGTFLERLVVQIALDANKYVKGLARVEAETVKTAKRIDQITSKLGKTVAANLGEGFTAAARQARLSGQAITANLGESFTAVARQAKRSFGAVRAQINSVTAATRTASRGVGAAAIAAGPAWAKVLPLQAPPVQPRQSIIAPPVQPDWAKEQAKAAKEVARINRSMAREAAAVAAAQAARMAEIGRVAQNAAAILSVPMVLFGKKSLSDTIAFEDAITRGGIAAGMTARQMEMMRKAAIDLSNELGMSATSIAGSFGSLIRGGLAFERVLADAGKAASMLAEVGGVETEAAANAVVKVLTVFKKDALSAEEAVNILSAAADASVISIHDMMLSLAQGSAMAAAAGQSYRDTATVIAMLGQAGLVASDAGTSLKVFFQRLTDDDAPAKFKALGISAIDAAGNVRPLRDLIGELSRAIKDMPSGQKLEKLTSIFGTDATRVALVLGEQGMAAFDAMAADMDKAFTVTEKYAVLLESVGGQWRAFTAAVERFAVVVGAHLVPILMTVTDFLERMMTAFENLNPSMQQVIVIAGSVATVMGVIAGVGRLIGANLFTGLLKIGPMIAGGFKLVTGAIAAVVAALGGPLTAALAVATAAVAGLVYWVVGPEGLSNAWETVTKAIGNFFQKAYGFIYNFRFNMEQLWSWFTSNWDTILIDAGSLVLTFFKNMMHNAAVAVRTVFRIFEALKGFLAGMFEQIWTVDFWKSVWEGLTKAFVKFTEWIGAIANSMTELFKQARDQWYKIFTGGTITFDLGKAGFKGPTDDFAAGKSDIGGAIKKILKDALSDLRSPTDMRDTTLLTPAPNLAFYTKDVFGIARKAIDDVGKSIVSKTKEYGATLVRKLEEASKLFWNPKDARSIFEMLGLDSNAVMHESALANMAMQQDFIAFRNTQNDAAIQALEQARQQSADAAEKSAQAFARLPDAMVVGTQEAANAILRSMAPTMPKAMTEEQLLKEQVDQHRKANNKLQNIEKNLKNVQLLKVAGITA